MATKLNDPCRDKSADDEPIFTLCARDATADVFVALWADTQAFIRQEMLRGVDPALALEYARQRVRWVFDDVSQLASPTAKELEAQGVGHAMRAWRRRKLAD